MPGYGHFFPLSALAGALTDAGHEVVVATAKDFCGRVEDMGFKTFPAGMSLDAQLKAANQTIAEGAMAPSKERFAAFVPRMLAGVAAPARARDLLPLLREWQPDLLLHEETELGGPLAAAASGVVWAGQSVGPLRPLSMARLAGHILAPRAAEWGADIGDYGGLFRYLYLDVCPPSLQSEEISEVDVAWPMTNVAPVTDAAPDDDAPPWLATLDPDRLTVYVSLGTLFNQDRAVFAAILDGLVDEPLNIILTLGPGADPSVFGRQPDHVHVEAFVPQDLILPHTRVVVNQGGTAVWSILAHGRPLLILPQGANQFHNAEICVGAGVARRLLPGEVDAAAVRREVRLLIEDGSYTARAAEVAKEIAAMPGPERGVELLERLAATRSPLNSR